MRATKTLLLIQIGAVAWLGFSSHSAHAQPAVPAGHPRVYVTPSDVPIMQAKLSSAGYADWYAELADEDLCSYSVCYAFRYLMGEPASVGETAVATSLAELQNVVDDGPGGDNCEFLRKVNNPVHYAALVYDWCYDLLSEQDKLDFIYEINRIVSLGCSPLGYDPSSEPPYDSLTVVTGHSSESWLLTSQLPAGVAIYDEAPELYENAADYFLTKFVPVRDFFYVSHMHHQGDSYITSRFQNDILASWLFERMGAGNVFDVQQQYVPYQIIYNMRPDYQQMRMGDTWNSDGRARDKRRILLLTGSYYDDPFQMYLVNHQVGSSPLYNFHFFTNKDVYRNSSLDRIFEFLFRDPNAVERTIADLPKTKYFAEPMGEMVARTGWNLGIDSRDAVVNMRIGQYFFGTHQRKDFGTWQIYYRGALAITSGYYQHMGCNKPHFKNYYQQTVAHNGLLIYHPLDVMSRDGTVVANDGGQQWPAGGRTFARDLPDLLNGDFQRGYVTAQQIGPDAVDPHYSYIAGDITAGYSTTSVSRVTRSMVSFNTHDPSHPMVFMVFDRVTSTSAGLKKRWLVHSINEPTVQGSKIVIVQDAEGHGSAPGQYGGKLVAHSLLPDQATLEKVGGPGQEFWIAAPDLLPDQGVNWMWDTEETHPKAQHEVGAWRVEVSPTQDSTDTLFLHAMTVQDATNPLEPGAELIDSPLLIGARMADHAALFGRDGMIESDVGITFDLPGVGIAQTLVCDLPSGFWCIRRNGNAVATATIPPTKTCLFFPAEPGLYALDQDPHCEISSLQDAGVQSDGGGSTEDDAGTAADAEPPAPGDGQTSGCGCSTGADRAPPIPLILPFLLSLLFLRRSVS